MSSPDVRIMLSLSLRLLMRWQTWTAAHCGGSCVTSTNRNITFANTLSSCPCSIAPLKAEHNCVTRQQLVVLYYAKLNRRIIKSHGDEQKFVKGYLRKGWLISVQFYKSGDMKTFYCLKPLVASVQRTYLFYVCKGHWIVQWRRVQQLKDTSL